MSFQWSAPFVAPRSAEPLLAARPGRMQPLSDRDCAYVTADGTVHVLDFQEWQALQATAAFLPRGQHLAALGQHGLARSASEAAQLIERLRAKGVLVDATRWLDELAALSAPRAQAPIDAIHIRCCDRPAAVAALLASLDAHQQRHGTAVPIRLLDDSRDPAASAALARLREGRDAAMPVVELIDAATARAAVRRLADTAGLAPDAVARQLLRHAVGNRFGGGRLLNLALLLSAGRRLMVLDDDMRLPLRSAPGARGGADLDAASNAVTTLFADGEAALVAGDESTDDALTRHWVACGAGAAHWLVHAGPLPGVDAIAGRAISDFTALTAASRIVATLNGHRGASGADNTVWMYRLPAVERAPLGQGPEHYRRLLDGESLCFAYPQAHLAERVWFSACALDNGTLLPCTAAGGRGEDALLHALIGVVDPEAVSLDLPLSIAHVPVGARSRRANNAGAWKPSLNRLLSDWIHEQRDAIRAEAPAERLLQIAARLRDLAGASARSRRDWVRDAVHASRCDQVERLERARQEAREMPSYWHEDVDRLIAANRSALCDPEAPALADWPALACGDDLVAMSTAAIDELAASLEAWPRLWTAAAELGPALRAPP